MGGVMNPNAFYGAAKLPQGGIMPGFQQLNLIFMSFRGSAKLASFKANRYYLCYGDQQD